MQNNGSTYRITLLLYLGLLILPVGFYIIYSSLQALQEDVYTLNKMYQNDAAVMQIQSTNDAEQRNRLAQKIDRRFTEITPWFAKHQASEYYVGGKSLLSDFNQLMGQWKKLKKKADPTAIKHYTKSTQSLTFIVEKMVSLREARIYNYLLVSVITMATLLLLLIYFVRTYIQHQLEKHSIYDLPTKLYNKKYLISSLKSDCARAARYNYPLSLLSVEMIGFGKEHNHYDKKEQKHILEMVGGLITALTRVSDIPCRYDETRCMIILPDTPLEGAQVLLERMDKAFEEHNFMIHPNLKFAFSSVVYDGKVSHETFIMQALEGLKEI